jgi:hypothetical protein
VTNDWHVWSWLPFALAVGYSASDYWRHAAYVLEHDAYSGNEQLPLKALAAVLQCLQAKSLAAPDRCDRQGQGGGDGSGE